MNAKSPRGSSDDERVPVFDGVTEIRERILIASRALDFPCALEQQRRLTNEVEGDVREGDVFLEEWPVPAPLREAMTEHKPIISESQQILNEVPLPAARCPLPAGQTPRTP